MSSTVVHDNRLLDLADLIETGQVSVYDMHPEHVELLVDPDHSRVKDYRTYFNITQHEFNHLFMSHQQCPDAYGGGPIAYADVKGCIAGNIREFVDWRALRRATIVSTPPKDISDDEAQAIATSSYQSLERAYGWAKRSLGRAQPAFSV